MFQTQFLSPLLPLLPQPPLPAPPIFIFIFFTKPSYFIISCSHCHSRAMKASLPPLSSPLSLSLSSSSSPLAVPGPSCAAVTGQFWVLHEASKMSQLIRSPTPFRDSTVLITVKELITGVSVDFCFSPSAASQSLLQELEAEKQKFSGNKVINSSFYSCFLFFLPWKRLLIKPHTETITAKINKQRKSCRIRVEVDLSVDVSGLVLHRGLPFRELVLAPHHPLVALSDCEFL